VKAAAAALVVIGAAVVAQQPTFRTEANYVRVDVYPTKDGMPVADLTQADFDVIEDRAPQKIEQFEHVVIRGNLPQETRVEPNTVAQSMAMAQNSRARLFVVFLDTYHVTVDGSHNIRRPLVDALNKLIGPDDLVGVMTPEMSANDVTFARRTTTIEGFLARYWTWGEAGRLIPRDQVEEEYEMCYPNSGCTAGIAAAMIARRREKMTMDAFEDLAVHLRGIREERKAIIVISDGWLLFRPDASLQRPLDCKGPPQAPMVAVDPRGGKLTTKGDPNRLDDRKCERDRIALSNIDDETKFRYILDQANRANASFYPIDPRGLVVFDTPMAQKVPLQVDAAMLKGRHEALRTLADATDGIAALDTNNLDASFKRITDDVSSYYLLGYYSTGKLDGRFHSITVRVKRPGVDVRARRGYLAATPEAVTAAAAGSAEAAAAKAAAAAESHAIETVVAPLNGLTRELPVRLQAAAGYTKSGAAAIWMVGELSAGEEWRGGAEADVVLVDASGASTLASAHVAVPIGARTFRATLAPSSPLAPGEYVIRVRARGAASSMATNETTRVLLAATPAATGAVFLRRGQSTGNREVPTADLRFRRGEQVRVEIPAPNVDAVTARLLDRTGKPLLAIPVAASVRDDEVGNKWQTAQVTLAPLAPGDYVIEITQAGQAGGTTNRTLAAFRVVP